MHKQPGGQSFDEDRSGDSIFGGQSFGRYGRIISGKKKLCTEERVLVKIFRNGEIISGYESSDND